MSVVIIVTHTLSYFIYIFNNALLDSYKRSYLSVKPTIVLLLILKEKKQELRTKPPLPPTGDSCQFRKRRKRKRKGLLELFILYKPLVPSIT